jgi:hypothetical protein
MYIMVTFKKSIELSFKFDLFQMGMTNFLNHMNLVIVILQKKYFISSYCLNMNVSV